MQKLTMARPRLDAPGWCELFRDDFVGPEGGPPDPARWRAVVGKPWAAGVESYSADPRHLSLDAHGHLRITATHTPVDGFVSAWVETVREDFRPRPGGALRVQARVKTAHGLGVDSAMFAWAERMRHLGDTEPLQGWYHSGEIDLFEVVNSQPDRVWGVVHSRECRQLPSLGMGTSHSVPGGAPLSDAFHTYAIVWTREPDSITWYLDGSPYLRLTPQDTTEKGWLFNQNVFFGLLVVIGSPGGPILPGDPDPADFPVTMLVDEVSVAELEPGA
jgi:hypothetical protein